MRTNYNYLIESIIGILTNIDLKKTKDIVDKSDKTAFLDYISKEFLNLKDYNILIMTGLSQSLINKPIYYYNLKDHYSFFSKINIFPKKIVKRMSRDYTLEFEDLNIMSNSFKILKNLKLNNLDFFSVKTENNKIFLELSYPDELKDDDNLMFNNLNIKVKDELTFLAIKNTIHNQKGYCYTNLRFIPNKVNIKDFYDFLTSKKFFNEA